MATETRVTFLSREQRFRFVVNGLMPSTFHYAYLERSIVNNNLIKPLGGNLGDPLKTDSEGALVFDYFYSVNLPTTTSLLDQAQAAAALVSGDKEFVVGNISGATLPLDYKNTFLSYWSTIIFVTSTF